MIYPWEYTEEEGGEFKPWTGGPVSLGKLKKLKSLDYSYVYIKGVKVHSLIFESAGAGEGNYARWDCVNGWTTTIQQAKKVFPNGLHGLSPLYRKDK